MVLFLIILVIFISYSLQNFSGFLISLFFLGVGWNFLFTAGTYLILRSYRPAEKLQVLTFNDFFIFGVQAVGTTFSGILLYYLSWQSLSIISGVILTGVFFLFLGYKQKTPYSKFYILFFFNNSLKKKLIKIILFL